MDNRREFIKKAALLSGGAGVFSTLPASIQKAFAINPAPGTTYLDAEHIVFLMQENRSFDHSYGTLQGVRGFNDPRAISQPNGNKIWAQTNAAGDTFAPFKLDLKDSKITWLGSLPHSWSDMTDARNEGKNDRWLDAKKSGRKECEGMPLTMGYFGREDIPFYYALADAFTVCDQHFCSSLTGTTPNRLYFWTGTIREKHDPNVQANVYNSDVSYGRDASWKTYPEYLEENDVSWQIYQNELSVSTGFEGEEDGWLANFTNNPLEWFTQYNVRFSHSHMKFLQKAIHLLPGRIKELEDKLAGLSAADESRPQVEKQLKQTRDGYEYVKNGIDKYNIENYEKLSDWHKTLHEKAFSDNRNDPDYRSLTTINYDDDGIKRSMQIPKGDLLHQFREDVNNGKLPTVSWVIAPGKLSDHPGSPWYGAWYLSEVIDILTKNPEVWKKTIFILNYDENDGYFDHVPPFVPPNPYKADSGQVSAGIDTYTEYLNKEQAWMKTKQPSRSDREGPIGLGFRVPLVIASPWSRGGWVNSEVSDLTSPIQFLEHFLQHKTKKKIVSEEITRWRRTVCSDLTSVFRPYNGEKIEAPTPVDRISYLETIHKAQFKDLPSGFVKLGASEITAINGDPQGSAHVPEQETGTRPACAIPYELYTDGKLSEDRKLFKIKFEAKKELFGEKAAGCPFIVFQPNTDLAPRNYAVAAGDSLTDEWKVADKYHLRVNGPNGFYREFIGSVNEPAVDVQCSYEGKKQFTGNLEIRIKNNSKQKLTIELIDNAYKAKTISKTINAGGVQSVVLNLSSSSGWYDLSVKVKGSSGFEKRYAGHVETGKATITDPYMGRVV